MISEASQADVGTEFTHFLCGLQCFHSYQNNFMLAGTRIKALVIRSFSDDIFHLSVT